MKRVDLDALNRQFASLVVVSSLSDFHLDVIMNAYLDISAELKALREVEDAARRAYDSREEALLGPARMNDLGHVLAKVPCK